MCAKNANNKVERRWQIYWNWKADREIALPNLLATSEKGVIIAFWPEAKLKVPWPRAIPRSAS